MKAGKPFVTQEISLAAREISFALFNVPMNIFLLLCLLPENFNQH